VSPRLEVPAAGLSLEPGEGVCVDDPERIAEIVGWGPRVVVRLDGRRIDHLSTARRVRRGLVIVSGTDVAADVSVRDHIAAVVSSRGADRLLAGAPRIAARASLPAGVLSGGERRILGWVRAIALRPRAVVLDRAGTGLDADVLAWTSEVVARWRGDGVSVVVRTGRPEERAWADPSG
jgi:ABC-type branched-subunit amino acid transport system ATPase component